MSAYVTYLDAAVAGEPGTVRRIERVHPTQAAATARAAAVTGVSAYAGDAGDAADVGGLIDTATGRLADPTRSAAAAALTAAWRARLHAAWRIWVDPTRPSSRQAWWPEFSAAAGAAALKATDRWAWHQIALGDAIASRAYGAGTVTDTARETAIAHVETVLSTLGETWYRVMLGDATARGEWSTTSTAAAARIYSDLITGDTLAVRPPDGAWTQLTARIPAGLRPDSPALR